MASWHQWPQTLCFEASYSLKVTETQLTQAECLPLAGAGSRDPPEACKFTATHPCCTRKREVVGENISQLQFKPTLLKLLYSQV